MKQLNYHHLYYFYLVARQGSIAQAARLLHVTPQTVSGQLTTFESQLGHPLFDRVGKRLHLNGQGKQVYQHAEEIFQKGHQLLTLLQTDFSHQASEFVVGLTDAIPKVLAYDFMHDVMRAHPEIRFVFKEERFDTLLSEMAINHIDMVLADRGAAPGTSVKVTSQLLGHSSVSFFARADIAASLAPDFPQSLSRADILMPGVRSGIALGLANWLESEQLTPTRVAEFDDSALLKLFGAEGFGVFCAPTCIASHVEQQYKVHCIADVPGLIEQFYALTRHNQAEQPVIKEIIRQAGALLAEQ